MPDHVHIQFLPYEQKTAKDVVWRIKGSSTRERSNEDRYEKADYIANNAVRAGLVKASQDYPWLWMSDSAC